MKGKEYIHGTGVPVTMVTVISTLFYEKKKKKKKKKNKISKAARPVHVQESSSDSAMPII